MLTRAMLSLVGAMGPTPIPSTVLRRTDEPIPQVLNDDTFERWRDFIHPSAAELASDRIEWNTTLWAGLTRAQEMKKPLMIWIMNGHPCGLT